MKHSHAGQLERIAEDLRTIANKIDLFLLRQNDKDFVATTEKSELRHEFHRVCSELETATQR